MISNESMDFNDPKEFDEPKSTVIPPSPMVLLICVLSDDMHI